MLALAWLIVTLGVLVTSATAAFPRDHVGLMLALAGWLHVLAFEREGLRAVWREHRLAIVAGAAVVAAMFAGGAWLQVAHPERASFPQPPQAGLLLCIAPLAVVLRDERNWRAAAAVLGALTLWHLVALPLEAVFGLKVSWHVPDLLPRPLGPLQYQASGLAWQAYYFPGLYLGAFYLATATWRWTPRTWLAASLAWALAVACVQSRSALAGALAASLLGVFAYGDRRNARLWVVAVAVAMAGAALFWLLFAQNKSGPGLRWVYLLEYLQRSFDAQWLWTGRGYTIHPDTSIVVPGWQWLHHSHNDVAQVAFTWGVPALVAYLVFWAALARLALRSWHEERYWPVLALVAVGPNLLTDLGLHHFEKTAFIALFAGMAMAARRGTPPLRP